MKWDRRMARLQSVPVNRPGPSQVLRNSPSQFLIHLLSRAARKFTAAAEQKGTTSGREALIGLSRRPGPMGVHVPWAVRLELRGYPALTRLFCVLGAAGAKPCDAR